MKKYTIYSTVLLTLAFLLTPGSADHHKLDGDWEALLNGRNLDGWHVVLEEQEQVDEQDIFTVSDGVIHVYPNQAEGSKQPFGAIITNESYSHYHLSLEYKWGTKKFQPRTEEVRDAGILFHILPPYRIWPTGVECQIQEGDTGDLWVVRTMVSTKASTRIWRYDPNGKLITRGDPTAFHRFPRSNSWEIPGWNRVEVVVRGDSAKFLVNGNLVNKVLDMKSWDAEEELWKPITQGPILLQAEGAEIYYRNIQIKQLEAQ